MAMAQFVDQLNSFQSKIKDLLKTVSLFHKLEFF